MLSIEEAPLQCENILDENFEIAEAKNQFGITSCIAVA